MNVFFDTSAFVKYFNVEKGTDRVTRIITNSRNQIWLSDLARLEIISALFRKYRNHSIDEIQLNAAIQGVNDELQYFNLENLNQLVIEGSLLLLNKFGKDYGLRTLDAIHLATFELVADKKWLFVSCDLTLCKISELLGYRCLNPDI